MSRNQAREEAQARWEEFCETSSVYVRAREQAVNDALGTVAHLKVAHDKSFKAYQDAQRRVREYNE
jgi:hypothetical protein